MESRKSPFACYIHLSKPIMPLTPTFNRCSRWLAANSSSITSTGNDKANANATPLPQTDNTRSNLTLC